LVIITEWDLFRALDLGRLKAALAEPVLVNLRNIYCPEEMTRRGFTYVSVAQPWNPKWSERWSVAAE
jgi:UDPglucose 6-dehydrogenase